MLSSLWLGVARAAGQRGHVSETGQPQLIVVRVHWVPPGGTMQEETFGPWPVAADESHLAEIAAFMRGWGKRSGHEAVTAVLSLVTSPRDWAENGGGAGDR